MTTRISPPANKSFGPNPFTAQHGLVISCAVGSTIDVDDHVALQAAANGWHISAPVYTTAGRPTAGIFKGKIAIDSTLNKTILYDGTQWRDVLSGAVV